MKERRIIDQFCIEELIDSAQNLNLKDIDYTFSVELKNGQNFWLDVIGKNHDVDKNGNKTNFTLCFHDLYIEKEMNRIITNNGGWRDSELRKWLNEEFFEQLPDWLQKRIIPVVKKSSTDEEIVETVDKIFIPSKIEVFGETEYSKKGEGEQYEFFKDWHNRIKGLEKDKHSTSYWLRSTRPGSYSSFYGVNSNGDWYYLSASITYGGCVPCFAI